MIFHAYFTIFQTTAPRRITKGSLKRQRSVTLFVSASDCNGIRFFTRKIG